MRKGWAYRRIILSVMAVGILCGCDTAVHTGSLPTKAEKTVIEPTQSVTPLAFPVIPPGSSLVVEKLVCYDGSYWEDGSGEEVAGVAGLMIYNPTNRMIDFVSFALEQDGEQLYFFAYQLPPMSRCLVLEYNKKICSPQKVTNCRELCIRWDYQELSQKQIDYVGLGPLMTIVNRDSRRLSHVTVWYKRYVREGDYYLGGAAYSAHILHLEPEERRTIRPEHYEAGQARIVAIQLEI